MYPDSANCTCTTHTAVLAKIVDSAKQNGAKVLFIPPVAEHPTLRLHTSLIVYKNKALELDVGVRNPMSPYCKSLLQSCGINAVNTAFSPVDQQHVASIHTQPCRTAAKMVHIVDHSAYVVHPYQSHLQLSACIHNALELRCVDLELSKHYSCGKQDYFSPLNENLALCFLPAFTKKSQSVLKQEFDIIEVSEAEALIGACSILKLFNDVLLPEACYEAAAALVEHGYRPIGVKDVDSLAKRGLSLAQLAMELTV